MRKTLFYLLLLAVLSVASSCTKQQTELSGDTLPQKVTILGHARYVALDKSLAATTPELVDAGMVVNIFYGIPGEGGKVDAFACKSIVTDGDGSFRTEIGCPPGQTLVIKVEGSYYADSYAQPETGSSNTIVDTYFYGLVEKQVPCGKAEYFDLLMTPSAYDGEEGLVQP